MPVDYRVSASKIARLRCSRNLGSSWSDLLANAAGTTFDYYDNANTDLAVYEVGNSASGSNFSSIERLFLEFDLSAYTGVTINNAYLRVVAADVDGLSVESDFNSYTGHRLNFVSSPDVYSGGITSADWTDAALGSVRFAETDKGCLDSAGSRRVLYFKLSSAGLSQLQSDAAAGGKFRVQMRNAADIDGTDANLGVGYRYQLDIPSGDAGAGGSVYSDVPQLVLDIDQAEAFNLRDSIEFAWNFENTGTVTNDEGVAGVISWSGTQGTLVEGPQWSTVMPPFGNAVRVNNSGIPVTRFSGYDIDVALPITLSGWFKITQTASTYPKVLDWLGSDSSSATKIEMLPFSSLLVRGSSASTARHITLTGSKHTGDPEDLPASPLNQWIPWCVRVDASGLVEWKLGNSPWMFDDRSSNFGTSWAAQDFMNLSNALVLAYCSSSQVMSIDHVMIWSRTLNNTEVDLLFGTESATGYWSLSQAWPFGLLHADMSVEAQSLIGEADPGALTIVGTDPEIGIVAAIATIDAQAAEIPDLPPSLANIEGASAGAAVPDAGAMTLVGVTGDDAVFVPGQMALAAQLFSSLDTLDAGELTIAAQPIPSDLDWCPDYNPSLPGGGYPDCDLDLDAQLIDMSVDAGLLNIASQAIAGGDFSAASLLIVGTDQDTQELYPSAMSLIATRLVDVTFYRVYIGSESLVGNVGSSSQSILDERTTSPYTGTLTNELAETVAKHELDAVQLLVYDKLTKTVIRETRDAIDLVNTDGSVDWLVTPFETSLINPDLPSSAVMTHVAAWEFCWGSHAIATSALRFATTEGSRSVTVTHSGHGFQPEDHVIFKGAPVVGGLEMDGVFVVSSVSGSQYSVTHINQAASTDSTTQNVEWYWNPMTTKHTFEFQIRKREIE